MQLPLYSTNTGHIMDDIIVFQLLKTKRRLTFDILYQREDTRYRGEDDGAYFTFKASNGVEVISRSRMDIQTERLWLRGASEDERSGSMVFSSDEKRDKAHEDFVQALREWVAFIRTGGWGTRPTPELYVPLIPEPQGVPSVGGANETMSPDSTSSMDKGWQDSLEKKKEENDDVSDSILHLNGFATETDAAALLGLDTQTLRTRIAERAVFALPEPHTGAWRIPVWALHLDMMGLPTLSLHEIASVSSEWEIHAFMSTPCSHLYGLRPFECLVPIDHLPLKLRAMREALALKVGENDSLVKEVINAMRLQLQDRLGESIDPEAIRHVRGSWETEGTPS